MFEVTIPTHLIPNPPDLTNFTRSIQSSFLAIPIQHRRALDYLNPTHSIIKMKFALT